jgi:hypothetical protein
VSICGIKLQIAKLFIWKPYGNYFMTAFFNPTTKVHIDCATRCSQRQLVGAYKARCAPTPFLRLLQKMHATMPRQTVHTMCDVQKWRCRGRWRATIVAGLGCILKNFWILKTFSRPAAARTDVVRCVWHVLRTRAQMRRRVCISSASSVRWTDITTITRRPSHCHRCLDHACL